MNRVFLVEDEAIIAMEIKDHLRTLGYEVCGHALRGEAALQQIPPAQPDLILMDIGLKGPLTGFDVAQGLRGVLEVPVIFLTAYSDPHLTLRAGELGAFGYLVKPFALQELVSCLEQALARQEATSGLRVSEAHLRGLLAQNSVPVGQLDTATGRFLKVNRKYCELLGCSSDDLLALDFMAVTHPEDLAEDLVHMARLQSGEVREFAMTKRLLRRDGSIAWVELRVMPLWAAGEAPTQHLAVVKEISAPSRPPSATGR